MTLKELIEKNKDVLAQYGDNYPAIAACLNAPTTIEGTVRGRIEP